MALAFPITGSPDHGDHPIYCPISPLCSFVSFGVQAFGLSDHGDHALLSPSINPFSAITSTGQSGQLCSQHTIKSHSFGSWKCCRKLRLRNSISIRTRCHRPGATSRNASTSGYCVPIHVTIKPSFSAIAPNRNTTPISFTGAKPSADRRNGSPYTGRSFRIFVPEFHPFHGPG